MLVTHLTEVCQRAVRRVKGQELAVESPPDEIGELLVYWAKRTEELERIAASDASAINDMLVADAFVHELDLRQALGAPPPPDDHPVYPNAIAFGAWGMGMSLDAHGLPALRIECMGRSWTVGAGEPHAVVGGHPYDMVRSCAGRRTREQIARLSWSQAPDRWMPAFAWGPFALPERPVEDLFADR
jgi:hypothetical protein